MNPKLHHRLKFIFLLPPKAEEGCGLRAWRKVPARVAERLRMVTFYDHFHVALNSGNELS